MSGAQPLRTAGRVTAMRDTVRELCVRFRDWVEGNGPHPSEEVIHDESPPELPFAWTPPKRSRFRELTVRERAGIWLDAHALRLLSGFYNAVSVLICLMLMVLLLTTVLELPDVPGASNSMRGGPVIAYGRHGALDALGSWSVMFAAALGGFMFRMRSTDRTFMRAAIRELKRFPGRLGGIGSGTWLMAAVLLLSGASLIVNGYAGPDWGAAAGAVLSAAVFIALSGDLLPSAGIPHPGSSRIPDAVMAAGSFLIIICSAVNAVSIASIAADLFIPLCLALITAAVLCAFCLRIGSPDFSDADRLGGREHTCKRSEGD